MIKKKIIYLFTSIFAFGIVLMSFPFIKIFELKRVIVVTDKIELKGLSELNGLNLLFMDEIKISSILIQKNLNLKSISVKKIYPSSLVLYTLAKTYKAQLKSNNLTILVDEENILLSDIDTQSSLLPLIEVRNISLPLNQKADWRIERAITLFKQLLKHTINIGNITLDGNKSLLKVTTLEGTEITISDKDDVYRVAASLQIIFNRFRIEGKNIRMIELRFDKPVVILGSGEKISSGLEL